MKLTKHGHACVSLDDHGRSILVDPGTFTPGVADLVARADAVLVTHGHVDHFDAASVAAVLEQRPDLLLFGPPDVVAVLGETASARAGNVVAVQGGETLDVLGTRVVAVGSEHATIHAGIEVPRNVGYLVEDLVFHPGDAYVGPGAPVHTLLVPVSGPWVQMGAAIDFVTAVAPRQTVAIHDVMLSEIGVASAVRFLGEDGLTGRPMLVLETGRSIDVAHDDAG